MSIEQNLQLQRILLALKVSKLAVELDSNKKWAKALKSYEAASMILLSEAYASYTSTEMSRNLLKQSGIFTDRMEKLMSAKREASPVKIPDVPTTYYRLPGSGLFSRGTSAAAPSIPLATTQQLTSTTTNKEASNSPTDSNIQGSKLSNFTHTEFSLTSPEPIDEALVNMLEINQNKLITTNSEIACSEIFVKGCLKYMKMGQNFEGDIFMSEPWKSFESFMESHLERKNQITRSIKGELRDNIQLQYDKRSKTKKHMEILNKKSLKIYTGLIQTHSKLQMKFSKLSAERDAMSKHGDGNNEKTSLYFDKFQKEFKDSFRKLNQSLSELNDGTAKRSTDIQLLIDSFNELELERLNSMRNVFREFIQSEIDYCDEYRSKSLDIFVVMQNIVVLPTTEESTVVHMHDNIFLDNRYKISFKTVKTLIAFVEGLISEYSKIIVTVLKLSKLPPLPEEVTMQRAWNNIVNYYHPVVGVYEDMVQKMKDSVQTPLKSLQNTMKNAKKELEVAEKQSVKNYSSAELSLSKARARLVKAERDEAAAGKDYNKVVANQKDPTKAMSRINSCSIEASDAKQKVESRKRAFEESQKIRNEDKYNICKELNGIEFIKRKCVKQSLVNLADTYCRLHDRLKAATDAPLAACVAINIAEDTAISKARNYIS